MTTAVGVVRPTREITRKNGEVITFTKVGFLDKIGLDAQWLRVQANRSLENEERKRLLDILEYAYRTTLAGRLWRTRQRDGDNAVWVKFPISSSPRTLISDALLDFEEEAKYMISEGTPVRTTNSVRGRRGTRLVEGFGDDLKITLWADRVTNLNNYPDSVE